MTQQTTRLWVCHQCEMIGTPVEAKAHYIARGHKCYELSKDELEALVATGAAAALTGKRGQP